MAEELERKYDVKIESTEDKVKFPPELKEKLKDLGSQNLRFSSSVIGEVVPLICIICFARIRTMDL